MQLRIRRPDDFHLHLRQGKILASVIGHTARQFERALVMPNTMPPILDAEEVVWYREKILAQGSGLVPLMSIKIVQATTPEMVRAAYTAGAIAGKLYPVGVTTNATDGVSDISALAPVFAQMEQSGMVLCLHGELPGTFSLDREQAFLPTLKNLAREFTKLRIVLEHASTEEAVECVMSLPLTVAATITVHHLLLTLDDIIGGTLSPHHFCKPVPKRPEDRAALRRAATSGNPKFFLGTDSAPHLKHVKECAEGAAGIFSAPVALPLLAEIFEAERALDALERFTAEFGAKFYDLPLNEGTIALVQESWQVPDEIGGIVPLWAGQEIAWQMAE